MPISIRDTAELELESIGAAGRTGARLEERFLSLFMATGFPSAFQAVSPLHPELQVASTVEWRSSGGFVSMMQWLDRELGAEEPGGLELWRRAEGGQ